MHQENALNLNRVFPIGQGGVARFLPYFITFGAKTHFFAPAASYEEHFSSLSHLYTVQKLDFFSRLRRAMRSIFHHFPTCIRCKTRFFFRACGGPNGIYLGNKGTSSPQARKNWDFSSISKGKTSQI